MSTNAQLPGPRFFRSSAFIVVGSVLFVFALLIAVVGLYESKLSPSRKEGIWLDSQRKMSESARAPLDDNSVVTLIRTRCYGSCPAYQVSLFGSGRVEFVGEDFVCDKRPAPARIDATALRQLVAGLDAIHFEDMPNYVRRDVTDNAFVTVILKRPRGEHAVRHYHGDTSAPRLLTWVEERIDEIAGSASWIGNANRCNENAQRAIP